MTDTKEATLRKAAELLKDVDLCDLGDLLQALDVDSASLTRYDKTIHIVRAP